MKEHKVGIIIQARMGSKRYPGKVIQPFLGKTVIEHVIDRAMLVPGVDLVILALHKSCISNLMELLFLQIILFFFCVNKHDFLRN